MQRGHKAAAGHVAHTIRKQKVANAHLASSLHAVWDPSPWKGPPTFRVSLRTSINLTYRSPPTHSQRFVSKVFPDPGKLIITINHHAYPETLWTSLEFL